MNILQKSFSHFKTITRHKIEVTKTLFRVGLYKQGILHDLSKYSPTEFFEMIKFYKNDKGTPIDNAKNSQGYSLGWLHHRGRNPHHHEYWIDGLDPISEIPPHLLNNIDSDLCNGGVPLKMPFKYAMEMIIDMISANKIYGNKDWTYKDPSIFWIMHRRNIIKIHPMIKQFVDEILDIFAQVGYSGLNLKKAKRIYDFLNCDWTDKDGKQIHGDLSLHYENKSIKGIKVIYNHRVSLNNIEE